MTPWAAAATRAAKTPAGASVARRLATATPAAPQNAPAQRTAAWHRARSKLLTASEIAALFRRTPEMCQAFVEEMQLTKREADALCDGKWGHPYTNEGEVLLRKLVGRDAELLQRSATPLLTGTGAAAAAPGTIAATVGPDTIVQTVRAQDLRKWRRMLAHRMALSRDEQAVLRALADAGFTISATGVFIHCAQGELPTRWGVRYEAIARNVYTQLHGCSVREEPLRVHSSIPFLGASPDGITSDGRLVELKCPFRGRLSSGASQFAYWVQTQIQMEVLDMDECDLFECAFEESPDAASFDALRAAPSWSLDGRRRVLTAGLGLKFLGQDTWLYAPLHLVDPADVRSWYDRVRNARTRGISWKLGEHRTLRFRRNREWFSLVRPLLEDAHARLGRLQGLFQHPSLR